MTEQEKMLSGQLYDPTDGDLTALRQRAHRLCRAYSALDETDPEREAILRQLLPHRGENVFFQGPVQFDYGCFFEIGAGSYVNFNFTCLDCAPVRIGKDAFIGPGVSLLTPMHPLLPRQRNARRGPGGWFNLEYARPITVGDGCWLGGGVTVCGGVTVGDGCVIGAGSVVTRDVPPGSLAAGVPCRVIRPLTEADALAPFPEE